MGQRGRWPSTWRSIDPYAALQEEATPSHAGRSSPHGIRRCGGPEEPVRIWMSWIGRHPYAPPPLTAPSPPPARSSALSRSAGSLQYFIRIPKTYSIILWQRLHLAVFPPSAWTVIASLPTPQTGNGRNMQLLDRAVCLGSRAVGVRSHAPATALLSYCPSPRCRRTASRKVAMEIGLER
jgi:hypothetical protein